ncbi:hypothetical protein BDP81DRAFT_163330 [Colletotrichum phormii]|uniref:Uncharacterized protein n=1 Tax=Colletotrichum phormii TaxID=359342 RepID=A0AAJ0EL05_9PEZI|nr:uncharacterized protein BDP81DRAFT_163330 [Colletotrichum phormii]KAK1640435.1 hypothetical protein BDP81DRAFT_163330 [Colletotrichum phormii]
MGEKVVHRMTKSWREQEERIRKVSEELKPGGGWESRGSLVKGRSVRCGAQKASIGALYGGGSVITEADEISSRQSRNTADAKPGLQQRALPSSRRTQNREEAAQEGGGEMVKKVLRSVQEPIVRSLCERERIEREDQHLGNKMVPSSSRSRCSN